MCENEKKNKKKKHSEKCETFNVELCAEKAYSNVLQKG